MIGELLGSGSTYTGTAANSLDVALTKLKECRSLKSTIESTTWLKDDKLRARLSFLERLYCYAQGHVSLVHRIVTDRTVSPTTIRDVARHIDHLGLTRANFAAAGEDPVILHCLRHNLFISEPTALVCGLIEAGIISIDSALKPHVLSILERAVRKGFNMREQSARSLLSDDREVLESVQRDAKNMVAALVRLHFLVDDPEDIAVLISFELLSAYSISNIPRTEFEQRVKDSGIDAAAADAIWTRSKTTHLRSQEAWIEGLRKKHEIPLKGALQYERQNVSSEAGANLSNLFKDLDQTTECADCSSVTSPAAYFVDLLHQLGMRTTDPSKSSPTLLQELFKRRPDLGDLKLSCANTKVLIPCIDLVNEALESVAANGSATVENAYNMADDDTDNDCSNAAGNTNFDVYRTLIEPFVFPLTVFPYNQAIDSVREYLEVLGSSRNELLTILRAPYRLVPNTKTGDNLAILNMSQIVLDRAISAEYLGLLGEDYIAITHEAFQTLQYLDTVHNVQSPSSMKNYQASIGVKTPGAYWGFQNDASMLNDTDGLTCIRDQFLPRAALSFEDMLSILKTRYVSRKLVISSTSSGKQEFSGKVADMRLRHYPPNASSSTSLQADECDDLQAFLRLWRKVGWPLEDMDAAVVMLAGNRTTGVDPVVIDGLAEIKRISSTTKFPVGDILPLWGDMDTGAERSIYVRIFLQPQLVCEDPVFAADAQGKYLTTSGIKISDHRQIIKSTLRLTDVELNATLSGAEWIDDNLTIQSISYIYRVAVFSRMLEISPMQYSGVLSLLPPGSNVFLSPRYTRSVLEQFQQLKGLGRSLDTILFAVAGVMDNSGVLAGFNAKDAIATTVEIVRENMNAVQDNIPSALKKDTNVLRYTQDEVARVSAALFGPEIGSEVERFIEGMYRT